MHQKASLQFPLMFEIRQDLLTSLALKDQFSTALYTILFNCLSKNSFGLNPATNKPFTDEEMTKVLKSIRISSLCVLLPYRTEVKDKLEAASLLEENFYQTMHSSSVGQHMMFYDGKRRYGELLDALDHCFN